MVSLKKLLLEQKNLVPVCMVCDTISPVQVGPNDDKSHGLCRDHYIAYVTQKLKTPLSLDDARKRADALEMKKKQEGVAITPNTSGAKDTDPLPES